MVACFGCGGLIDVCDRYCRWCGRTFIPDNYGPPEQQAVNSTAPYGDGWINNPECRGIGQVLTQGIFRDDETELGTVMNLIETRAVTHDVSRGY